jgi:hypothetical protein
MRERALGVQAGLTSVANEVVVLLMVGGTGSTAARGLRRPAGSSSWPGTTSTDPHQPCLGWPDVRPHASNCVLIMQGAVGLVKSRAAVERERRRRAGRLAAAVRRMRVLWIYLARSRIWMTCVTVILSSPRTVHLLTLTSGPVSWAMMVSELGSPLLGVGSTVIFFILVVDCDAWACHNFFGMKLASLIY